MLKNFEKLNGFKIIPTTQIEVIYDLSFNIVGYFVMVYRENYPFPMYIKLNSTLDTVQECYPYILQDDKKYSLKIIKKNIPFKTEDLFASVYFSWNLENDDTSEEYRGHGFIHEDTLACYKNKHIKTTYTAFSRNSANALVRGYPEIGNFFLKEKADYMMIYFDGRDESKPKKFFLGYTFTGERWKELAEQIDLKGLVAASATTMKF